jgi:hypothetical protein
MNSVSTFLREPLAGVMWLFIAAVITLVGLRGVTGPAGIAVAALGVLPLVLVAAGPRLLRRWPRGTQGTDGSG